MDAITSNEKFVQGALLGRSRSFSLGRRDGFLAASSVPSSTITIVSRVATGHGLSTGDVCVENAWISLDLLTAENVMEGIQEIQQMILSRWQGYPEDRSLG